MQEQTLKGKRCVGLTRCSKPGQGGDGMSNDQQASLLETFAAASGMVWVGEERAEGVSASRTDNRVDIENLLYRAETSKDYDVVLVLSYDRFTRGGADHGAYLIFRFLQLGVQVVSATNDIPDNEYAPVLRDIEFIKGQGAARSISLHVTRGAAASLFDGRMTYTRMPAYGIDRLILSATGQKLFRIRNLPDGTQHKVKWDCEEVIEKYPRNPRRGVFQHFQKRPDEKIVLVPGAKEAVDTVKLMYHMWYVEQKGVSTIARELNGRGIVAPKGGSWNQASVYVILHNPIYVQRGIANRVASGLFHIRPSEPGVPPIRARTGPKYARRPQSEWVMTHHPEINFIPEALRDEIWEHQLACLLRRIEGDKTATRRGTRGGSSGFLLLGSIWDRSTGEKMVGHCSGPRHLHRYYMVLKHRTNPHPDQRGVPKCFPADAAEQAVVEALVEVLGNADEYVPVLERYAAERVRSHQGDVSVLESLKAEREGLREKKAFALDEFDDLGPELLRKKLAPLTSQIRALDERIAMAEKAIGIVQIDSREIVQAVRRQIKNLTATIGAAAPGTLRKVLNVFTRTVVNLPTKEAEIEVRIPDEALGRADALKVMCETSTAPQTCGHNTHDSNALVLARYHCHRRTIKRKPCLECSRLKAAA